MRLAFNFAVILSLAVLPASAQSPNRARATADQMITALGGEAFTSVKDLHTTGRFFSFVKGELTGGDVFNDYIKFPDMERTEFGRDKRKLSIQINKGDQGWSIEDKEVKPQPVTESEEFVKGFKTSFDYVLRFVINHPQTTLQNLGGEIIDFKRVDILELRDPAKNRIRFYIDRDTHLPVKMQVRRVNESELREEQFGNWHKFQGVNTPLFVSRYTDGVKTMEIRVEAAEYNTGLADSLFAPPASAK
jgi:hypothetical protein